MMKRFRNWILLSLFLFTSGAYALPPGFVYLHDIDPSILQDMRYSGNHNFVGHPINGYQKGTCILTLPAAKALAAVQKKLKQFSLSLKVYDCYRPTRAVSEFFAWSKNPYDHEMKDEFYPHTYKSELFPRGYIAEKSGHSRGSTVDLTLVKLPAAHQPKFQKGEKLVACTDSWFKRYRDNSIDMGTGYDCLDERAHVNSKKISALARRHRLVFQNIMVAHGFEPYGNEWWHFTLKKEPWPKDYFNFIVK